MAKAKKKISKKKLYHKSKLEFTVFTDMETGVVYVVPKRSLKAIEYHLRSKMLGTIGFYANIIINKDGQAVKNKHGVPYCKP